MHHESYDSALKSVILLIRRGRFAEALKLLQSASIAVPYKVKAPLLGDLLQRTGKNTEAARVAIQSLQSLKGSVGEQDLLARSYWTLGNVARENGDSSTALKHFHAASKFAGNSSELACWVQLRLISIVADIAGTQIALARLGELKRYLTRLGDERPFCALHLWIVEVETRAGNMERARRHLEIARTLLERVDDVWLQGYFAINSFGVSYYSAKMSEARYWAEKALEFSTFSGHAAAQRAANANLGHVEFALGRLRKAGEYFDQALACGESGSPNHLALLDSLAQIKLHVGEFEECEAIINRLDAMSTVHNFTAIDYKAWSLQTKLQLFLRQNRVAEAAAICKDLDQVASVTAQPRLRTILTLLSVETSLAQSKSHEAAHKLRGLFSNTPDFTPDLLAETDRMIARTLCASGFPGLARTSVARAIDIYDLIGHEAGKSIAKSDLSAFALENQKIDALTARSVLDRIRILLETRGQPDLFAKEASHFLTDLDCATDIFLSPNQPKGRSPSESEGSSQIEIGPSIHSTPLSPSGPFLQFSSRPDPGSIISCIAFQRVVERIIRPQSEGHSDADDIFWSQTDGIASEDVVFAADSMIEILKTVRKVATTNLSVLVTGETGVGKEIVAKAIHERSQRTKRPFAVFNCAAVPRDLLESQLFGYRRGAFSGATEPFEGVIRAAHGGTLFLDEVGEIPIDMQPKLLRFLETGEIHPLGDSQPTKVDVRLIFATNADLEELVAQRRFREDLLFRINVVHIRIPPLRERREEIPLLVNLFCRTFAQELDRVVPKFRPETIQRLIFYDWPGNIRQLNNEVRRVLALSEGDEISPDCLSLEIRRSPLTVPQNGGREPSVTISLNQELSHAIELVERTMIDHALKEAQGRPTVAAKSLGLSRKGLFLKRQRFGMLR